LVKVDESHNHLLYVLTDLVVREELLREKGESVEEKPLAEDLAAVVVFEAVAERRHVAEEDPAGVTESERELVTCTFNESLTTTHSIL
jgi:hypothetical protein